MKKRISVRMLSLFFGVATLAMVGCSSTNPSETSYWFSKSSTNFVAYDEETNNLDKAGNYWYFTAAKNVETMMNLIINVNNFSSAAYLYVNDAQVRSETDTGVYTYVYKLSLKKEDEIKIHAFWVNSLYIDDNGFEIQQISMSEDGKTYILSEFDKLK